MKSNEKAFKQAVNACICNVKAALAICRKNSLNANAAALAYVCQAHNCAKQVQLLAVITGDNNYKDFYNYFIRFNRSFMQAASNNMPQTEACGQYELLIQQYEKLSFSD